MQTYKIDSPIKVNGRIMKTGVVSLKDEDAEPLLESGAITPAPEQQEPEKKAPAKSTKAKG